MGLRQTMAKAHGLPSSSITQFLILAASSTDGNDNRRKHLIFIEGMDGGKSWYHSDAIDFHVHCQASYASLSAAPLLVSHVHVRALSLFWATYTRAPVSWTTTMGGSYPTWIPQ